MDTKKATFIGARVTLGDRYAVHAYALARGFPSISALIQAEIVNKAVQPLQAALAAEVQDAD